MARNVQRNGIWAKNGEERQNKISFLSNVELGRGLRTKAVQLKTSEGRLEAKVYVGVRIVKLRDAGSDDSVLKA